MQQRLILFCPEIDVDVDRIRQTLADVGARYQLQSLEVAEIRAPEDLPHGAWTALVIRPATGAKGKPPNLVSHVEAVVTSVADALANTVLGIHAGGRSARARASLRDPGGLAKNASGDVAEVLRLAATWIDADPDSLLQFFMEQLAAGAREAMAEIDEADDDDRFVEAKLKQARELMQRYRSGAQ